MTLINYLSLTFALLALVGAAFFFWVEKTIAGFAFIVAFVLALAGAFEQRVVLSSSFVGMTIEKDGRR